MKTEKLRAEFERAMVYAEALSNVNSEAYISVTVGSAEIAVAYFPQEQDKETVTRLMLGFFGKLTKDSIGNLQGNKEGLRLTLFGVLKCEIVGHKKITRPKVVPNEFEEVEVPVYACKSPIIPQAQEGIVDGDN